MHNYPLTVYVLFSFLIYLLSSFSCQSQGYIFAGKVLNEKKEGLSQIPVEIIGYGKETVSDEDGIFLFRFDENELDRAYTIKFDLDQYKGSRPDSLIQDIWTISASSRHREFMVLLPKKKISHLKKSRSSSVPSRSELSLDPIVRDKAIEDEILKTFKGFSGDLFAQFEINSYKTKCVEVKLNWSPEKALEVVSVIGPLWNDNYRNYIQNNSNDSKSMIECGVLLAIAYGELEKYPQAFDVFRFILKNDQNNWYAAFRFGHALRNAGEHDQAIKVFKDIKWWNASQTAASYMGVAMVYNDLNKMDSVRAYLRQSKNLASWFEPQGSFEKSYNLSVVYEMHGVFETAFGKWENALESYTKSSNLIKPYLNYGADIHQHYIRRSLQKVRCHHLLNQVDSASLELNKIELLLTDMLKENADYNLDQLMELHFLKALNSLDKENIEEALISIQHGKSGVSNPLKTSVTKDLNQYLNLVYLEGLILTMKSMQPISFKAGEILKLSNGYKQIDYLPLLKSQILAIEGENALEQLELEKAEELFLSSETLLDSIISNTFQKPYDQLVELNLKILDLMGKKSDLGKTEAYFDKVYEFIKNAELYNIDSELLARASLELGNSSYAKTHALMAYDLLKIHLSLTKKSEPYSELERRSRIEAIYQILFTMEGIYAINQSEEILEFSLRLEKELIRNLLVDIIVQESAFDENACKLILPIIDGFHDNLHSTFNHETGKHQVVDKSANERLLLACEFGYVDLARKAIEDGAGIEFCGEDKLTALQIAVFYGHYQVYELLLESGARTEVKTNKKETLLHLACYKGNKRIVEDLLSRGVPVNAKCKSFWKRNEDQKVYSQEHTTGVTALMIATRIGDLSAVKLLCSNGAKVRDIDGDGNTVLYHALQQKNEELVLHLMELGARPTNRVEKVWFSQIATSNGMNRVAQKIREN